MQTKDPWKELCSEDTLLGKPADEVAFKVPAAPQGAELEALRARVREADHRAMDAIRVKADAEDEVRRLRSELADSEKRAREAEQRERAALASVKPSRTKIEKLEAKLNETRASASQYLGRCIDKGQLTNIKQVIGECNQAHKKTVDRLQAELDEATTARAELEAQIAEQAAHLAEFASSAPVEDFREQFELEMDVARKLIAGLEDQCARAERRVVAHRDQAAALRKHLGTITKKLGLRTPIPSAIEPTEGLH